MRRRCTNPEYSLFNDDACMGDALAGILKTRGYETRAVRGWHDERLAREAEEGPFDVVLADLGHPDLSEPGALDRLRSVFPFSEVILLTAYSTLNLAIKATEQWAYAYILKPYEPDQLFLHMRHAVEKQESAAGIRRVRESLEEQVRELTAELEQARETVEAGRRAKAEFVSTLKKELTTPLNVITGCSAILLNDLKGELSEKQREFVLHILDCGRSLQSRILYTHEFLEEEQDRKGLPLRQ
ncbi:MAG: response regulator [Nitrospiraceae bacterium]|nr:response regulator [Nitrospiraceae bacterium]